jgi:hypothetical protein
VDLAVGQAIVVGGLPGSTLRPLRPRPPARRRQALNYINGHTPIFPSLRRTLAPAALSATPADSPIAQLKNRRAEAQPIATAERRARIARAQQLMAENKIDAICLAGGTSLNYFSGRAGAIASACS